MVSNITQAFLVSAADEMNPTRRSTMEDVHVVHQPGSWNCNDTALAYMAVYDGHGGREIVNFLEEFLAKNVAEELNHVDPDEMDDSDEVDSSLLSPAIHKRIEQAFLITDIQSRMNGITSSGSTVCMCLVKRIFSPEGQTRKILIHAANVGDARIVLYHPGIEQLKDNPGNSTISNDEKIKFISRLTQDHRASDPDEVRRVEQAGGFVLRDRVVGILAVSRSVGDHGMKDYVIATPFQRSIEFLIDHHPDGKSMIEETRRVDDAFIILACDGVWDVFTDEEAVSFVIESLALKKDGGVEPKATKANIAQLLCSEAVRRGSTDNVTAIVAWL